MAFLHVLILCLVALNTAADPTSDEALRRVHGNSNETTPGQDRIVGGTPVVQGDLKYVCSVIQYGKVFCGCSVIALQYALTAATCKYLVPDGENLKIAAGSNLIQQGTILTVDEITTHPKFDRETSDYDIAVLRTAYPIVGINIAPVLLPPPNAIILDGEQLVVAGFGAVYPQGPNNPVLLKAEVSKVPQALCILNYEPNHIITSRMLCAAAPGKDSCQGDAGAALVKQLPVPGGLINIQLGIASFGAGCADPDHPGVYVRITNPEIRKFIWEKASV